MFIHLPPACLAVCEIITNRWDFTMDLDIVACILPMKSLIFSCHYSYKKTVSGKHMDLALTFSIKLAPYLMQRRKNIISNIPVRWRIFNLLSAVWETL